MKKIIAFYLITLAASLCGCTFGASMSQQVTSFNVDCKADEVKITDETVDLSGEESWIAECGGKTYSCTYLPESDNGCYEIKSNTH